MKSAITNETQLRLNLYTIDTKSGTFFGTISTIFNILRNNINLYLILFFYIGTIILTGGQKK